MFVNIIKTILLIKIKTHLSVLKDMKKQKDRLKIVSVTGELSIFTGGVTEHVIDEEDGTGERKVPFSSFYFYLYRDDRKG